MTAPLSDDDLQAILAVTGHDHGVQHEVPSRYDALFTWDYTKGARPRLDRLYEKAKVAQWNAQTDLPWDTDVDPVAVVMDNRQLLAENGLGADMTGTPFERWTDADWLRLDIESQKWMLSQF